MNRHLRNIFSLLLAAGLVGAFISLAHADVAVLNPSTCLGTWGHPELAAGEPQTGSSDPADMFTPENSALFNRAGEDIYCGGFDISTEENGRTFKNATVKLVWAVAPPTPTPENSPEVVSETTFDNVVLDASASDSFIVISETPSPSPEPSMTVEATPTESVESSPEPTQEVSAESTPEIISEVRASIDSFTSSESLDDFIEVAYTTDGSTWHPLARYSSDNLAGATLTLPITSWYELTQLQIAVRGIQTDTTVPRMYLDGMAVQVEYEKAPSPSPDSALETIFTSPIPSIVEIPVVINDTEPTVEPSEVPSLSPTATPIVTPPAGPVRIPAKVPHRDFRASEEPVFDLRAIFGDWIVDPAVPVPSPTLSPVARVWKKIMIFVSSLGLSPTVARASPLLPDQLTAEVFDQAGKKADIDATIEYVGGAPIARLIKSRAFRPGKYELRILVVRDGQTFVSAQDFSWGVLALNVDRSVYRPGDIANIGIGVLDRFGKVLCDSDVALDITDISTGTVTRLSTRNGLIRVNPECVGRAVTSVPDYGTSYRIAGPGVYLMRLSAVTKDGQWTIDDQFVADPTATFDVRRESATRTVVSNVYPVSIFVTPRDDFTGTVTEHVPDSFTVSGVTGNGTVRRETDARVIEWNVAFKKGLTYQLSYSYMSPDISPEFYLLGPLQVGTLFQEARQWQIAADATEHMILFQDAADSTPTGWTCISCAGGQFENVYPVGSASFGGAGAATGYIDHFLGAFTINIGAANITYRSKAGTGLGDGSATTYGAGVLSSLVRHLPPHRGLKMIQSNAVNPATLPLNAIALFDTTNIPSGFGSYTSEDNYFIVGSASALTGGSKTHTHTTTIYITQNNQVGAGSGQSNAVASLNTHSHTGPDLTTDAQSNQPVHIGVILRKVTVDGTAVPEGMIAMFDATPTTTGWNVVSGPGGDLENKYIMASTSYGTVSGANSHTHSIAPTTSGTDSTTSNTNNDNNAAGSASGKGHTHSLSFSNFAPDYDPPGTANTKVVPPYKAVIFGKYTSAATLTLTMDSGGTVAFGTTTPGAQRKTGTTRLKVTQSNATSLSITAGRQRAITNVTLASAAAPSLAANRISDTAGGIDVFSTLAACGTAGSQTAAWPGTLGTSSGLGFTNFAATSGKDTTCWGTGSTVTDANNKYAALQASASAASFISASTPAATFYASVGYSLEVANTQKSTSYDGGVVYTATVSP